MTTTAVRSSFFQTRLAVAAPTGPVLTRAAQPATPRPLPSKPSSQPSAIVIAWDNVIFPTNWLADCVGLRVSNAKSLEESKQQCLANPFTAHALLAIEAQIIDLLALTTSKSPVFILTDNVTSVMELLCATFFPRLKSCLANASGRVHIMSSSSARTPTERAAWKLSALQQICTSAMNQQNARSAVTGSMPFMVLMVSADETELHAAARVQELVAGYGSVQSLSLPATTEAGKPLALVDFHKQLQRVTAALASQFK